MGLVDSNDGLGCLFFALLAVCTLGSCSYTSIRGYSEIKRNAIEQRGYLVPQRFEKPHLVDLDRDGRPESITQYKGRTFLARVDTNGVPYFVPYNVNISLDRLDKSMLETEVEK